MSLVHPSVTPEQQRASLVCVFISFAMFLATIYLAFAAWSLNQSNDTVGRIVALDKKNRPTVQFRTPSGMLVSFRERTSSPYLNYEVGTDVKVLFRAEHPQDAQIAGNQWWEAIILGIITSGFGYFGIAGLRGRAVVGPLRQRRLKISVD